MIKNQKVVEGKNAQGNVVKVIVRKPDRDLLNKAQRIYAHTVKMALESGYMFKSALEKKLKEQGVFTDEDHLEINRLREEIFNLTEQLKTGKDKDGNTLKLNDAKSIAYNIRGLRNKINSINEKRTSLEQYTVEESAENARFDFLASKSLLKEDGSLWFNSVEEYDAASGEDYVQKSAYTLMSMLYGVDEDWQKNLIENKFLLKYNFVNPDTLLSVELEEALKKMEESESGLSEEPKFLDDNGNLV